MLGIGLSGAHRTGKTTLAKEFSSQSGVDLLTTSATKTFKRLGIEPSDTMQIEQRLMVQTEILKDFEIEYKQYESSGKSWIADRTPVDLIMYTLAECLPSLVDAARGELVQRYIDECYRVLNKYFAPVIVLQPGITLVEEEGKAACHETYIEHLNAIAIGVVGDGRFLNPHFIISRSNIAMNSRLESLVSIVDERDRNLEQIMSVRDQLELQLH